MGYNTDYKLDIQCSPCGVNTTEIIKEIAEVTYCLTETGDCYEGGKWYNHEKEMKAFSKKYPEITFELTGCGEDINADSPDIWKKYFKDGKMQECRAKVTFDNYDIQKLV